MQEHMRERASLEALLGRTRMRLLLVGAARGALAVAGGAGTALFVLFASDRLVMLPALLRAAASAAFVVVAVALLYSRVIVLLVRPPGMAAAANALEKAHREFGDLALSAVELAIEPQRQSSAPSPEFVEMTVEEAMRRAEGASPSKAVPSGVLLRPLVTALAAALVWAGAAWAFPADVAAFLRRFADPLGAAQYPTRTRIVAIEAPSVLPRDAPFRASVVAEGVLPDEAVFHVKPGGGSEQRLYAQGKDGRYDCTLEKVGADFHFFVEVGDARSGRRTVKVVERPSVLSVRAQVAYPSYTGVGVVTVSGGNIGALRKSRVTLGAEFNKPVRSAVLEFGAGGKVAGALAQPAKSATFQFEVGQADDYTIALVDEYGFENAGASRYRISAQEDAAPAVTLLRPGRDLTVVPNAVIPVEIAATDDYGVGAISLSFTIKRSGKTQEGEYPLVPEMQSPRSARSSAKWEIAALGLSPGDEITYCAAAVDNLPDGPQKGRSTTRSARVVSVAEKIAELGRIDARVQAGIANATRRQEDAIGAVVLIPLEKGPGR